jgi:ribosomal protein RSM22 (predicted rRNA methylase)
MSTKLQIIKQIKKKPELSYIDNSLISQVLENYLDKYKISLKNLKPSQQKTLVKEIRAQLRLYTGRFQKGTKKRDLLLKQNKISDLLKTHTSTAERLSFYPELKKLIEKLKVKSILDLGCGLNPIALANKDIKYNASDVQTSDLKLVGTFFKKNKISGKVFMNNLLK